MGTFGGSLGGVRLACATMMVACGQGPANGPDGGIDFPSPDAKGTPSANDDAYSIPSRVVFDSRIGSVDSLFANDGMAGAGLEKDAIATSAGGLVTIDAAGDFVYEPPFGYRGSDSFTYTLANAQGNSTASVTLEVGAPVWFIDNTASTGGDGSRARPFASIEAFHESDVAAPYDIVCLRAGSGAYVGSFVLKNFMKVIGEGTGIDGVIRAGKRPTLRTSTGDAIHFAINNEVAGFNISDTPNGVALVGGSGVVRVRDMAISGVGGAVWFETSGLAHLDVQLDAIISSKAPTHAIRISQTAGQLRVTGETVISQTGETAVVISDSNTTIDLGNVEISHLNGALALDVHDAHAPVRMGHISLIDAAAHWHRVANVNLTSVSITDFAETAFILRNQLAGSQFVVGDVTLANGHASGLNVADNYGGHAKFGNVIAATVSGNSAAVRTTGNRDIVVTMDSVTVTDGHIGIDHRGNRSRIDYGQTTLLNENIGLSHDKNTGDIASFRDFVADVGGVALTSKDSTSIEFTGAKPRLTSATPSVLIIDQSRATTQGFVGWHFDSITGGTGKDAQQIGIVIEDIGIPVSANAITLDRGQLGMSLYNLAWAQLALGDVRIGEQHPPKAGIDISDSPYATFRFADVHISSAAGDGLRINGGGETTMDIASSSSTIDSLGGRALNLVGVTVRTSNALGVTLARVTSDQNPVVILNGVIGTVSIP